MLKNFISDWRSSLPLAGLAVVGVTSLYYFLRPKPENEESLERQRRAYLNRVGRIVEGQVLDVADGAALSHDSHPITSPLAGDDSALPLSPAKPPATSPASARNGKHEALVASRHGASSGNGNGLPKLLYYTYSISGVTYETAQDITGLEEQLHLERVAAGQTASVKYDPSNPSNSILLADDWSGLH
jgi:hypothetical protein